MKFVTSSNYKFDSAHGAEKTVNPSATQPDMSMTIREILYRFSQGKPINSNNGLMYTGEDHDAPDIRAMDLVDIDNAVRANAQRIKDLDADIKAKQAARKAAATARREAKKAILSGKDGGDSKPDAK